MLEKGQLIDRKATNRNTLITLIDPDTYAWQSGIYSRKGANKNPQKGPTKGQPRATTLDDKDDQEKNIKNARTPPIGGEEEEELSEEESARFEASFSPTKMFVLSVWKAEREKYGLRFIKSPRNYRAADSIAAMIDAGDWTRDDLVEATRNFMGDDWTRCNLTMANLYEDFEKWLNYSEKPNDNRSTGKAPSRPNERKARTPDYSTTRAGEAV